MLGRYVASTMIYGGLHFASRAPDCAEYRHQFTGEASKQQLLLTHYAGRMMYGQMLGPVLWPLMLYDDVTYVECMARGTDWTKYGSELRYLTM